jgi:hypothetical protein
MCLIGQGVVGECTYKRQPHNVIKSERLKMYHKLVAVEVASKCTRNRHVTANPKRVGRPHPRDGIAYTLGSRGEVVQALAENSKCATDAIKSAARKLGRGMKAMIPATLREYYTP